MYSYLHNHAIRILNHFVRGFQDYNIKKQKLKFLVTCLHQSFNFGVD
jgi:hypothetical protein